MIRCFFGIHNWTLYAPKWLDESVPALIKCSRCGSYKPCHYEKS